MKHLRNREEAIDSIRRIMRGLRNIGVSLSIRTFSIQRIMEEWRITENEVRRLEREVGIYENYII